MARPAPDGSFPKLYYNYIMYLLKAQEKPVNGCRVFFFLSAEWPPVPLGLGDRRPFSGCKRTDRCSLWLSVNMLVFAGGDSLVLFEGPDQALGVPEAHRLGSGADRLGLEQFFGCVHPQPLDVVQNVGAGGFLEGAGQIGAAHLELGRNRCGGQLIFGVMVQDILLDLLHPAGRGGSGVLRFFVFDQFVQDRFQLLFEVSQVAGPVQTLFKGLGSRKVVVAAHLLVDGGQNQGGHGVNAVFGHLDVLHAGGKGLVKQLVQQAGNAGVVLDVEPGKEFADHLAVQGQRVGDPGLGRGVPLGAPEVQIGDFPGHRQHRMDKILGCGAPDGVGADEHRLKGGLVGVQQGLDHPVDLFGVGGAAAGHHHQKPVVPEGGHRAGKVQEQQVGQDIVEEGMEQFPLGIQPGVHPHGLEKVLVVLDAGDRKGRVSLAGGNAVLMTYDSSHHYGIF